MSDGTLIEWTDASWNPLRAFRGGGAVTRHGWACVRVSQGCVNCYAATINKRLGTGLDYTVPALAKVETYVDEKALVMPLRWRKPRKVFVCSMTDLFGEWVTDAQIDRVFQVMHGASRHTFQVLTKRPERARAYLGAFTRSPAWDDFITRGGVPSNEVPRGPTYFPGGWPLPNVWLGTSVENQATADERIPQLLATPAAVRFLSCEPLLGPVDLRRIDQSGLCDIKDSLTGYFLTREEHPIRYEKGARINWVIIGGESGPHARPTDIAWVRSLVAQCHAAGVAPFVKQLGSKPISHNAEDWLDDDREDGSQPHRLRDRKGGDMAEWPADLRVREFA